MQDEDAAVFGAREFLECARLMTSKPSSTLPKTAA
jgi:hypothetical protein